MKNLTTFAAWTRKAGTNEQLTTQLIRAKSIKDAKSKLIELGREIDGKVYKY